MTSATCKGLKSTKPCIHPIVEGEEYCVNHMYFKTYSDEMMENLQICTRCANMFYYEGLLQCPPCTDRSRNKSKETSEVKKKIPKCNGITKTGTKCTRNQLSGSKYCDDHSYMKDYTKDMIKKMRQCSNCNSYRYFDIDFSTCNKCRDYRKNERTNKKECEDVHKCEAEKCNNNAPDTKYCGKHNILQLREDAEKDGYKLCGGGNHACSNRIKLESKHTYCDECLEKNRVKDKEHYQEKKKEVSKHNSENDSTFMCAKCKKIFPIEEQVKDSHGNISSKCKQCFELQQSIEKNRPVRFRDWHEEHLRFLNVPRRVANKQQWKIDNAEKLRGYWAKYRQMLKDDVGVDEYHAMMAKQMRSYWERNPQKRILKNIKIRKNPIRKIYDYKYSATARGIDIDDTMADSVFISLMTSQCHYCGKRYEPNGYLLGIDRVDNSTGYCVTNCVACCDICNYMKGTHTKDEFVKICNHIYHKIFNCTFNLNQQLFNGRKHQLTLARCKYGATERNIEINLTEENVSDMSDNECYICGHISSDNDYNGIDRINSDGSYSIDNCKSCCSTCNYLKNDLSLPDFLIQIIKIVTFTDGDYYFGKDPQIYNEFVSDICVLLLERSNIDDMCTSSNIYHQPQNPETHDEQTIELSKCVHEKKQTYYEKQQKTLGDDAYRAKRRDEKRIERGQVDKDGHPVGRVLLTEEESRARKTEQQRKRREIKKQEISQEEISQTRVSINTQHNVDSRTLYDLSTLGIKFI